MNHPSNRAERLREKYKHEQKAKSLREGSKRKAKEELKARDAAQALEEALN